MKSAPNPAHVIYAIPSPRKILSQLLQIRSSLRPLLLAAKRIWVTFSKTGSDLPCDILNPLYVGFIVFFFVPCSPCLVPWDKLVSKVQVLSQNHGVAMLLDVK